MQAEGTATPTNPETIPLIPPPYCHPIPGSNDISGINRFSGSNDAPIKRCAVKPKPEPMRKMTRLGGKSALRPESIAAGSRLVGGGLEEFRQTQPDFMFAAGFDDRRVRAGEQVALDR